MQTLRAIGAAGWRRTTAAALGIGGALSLVAVGLLADRRAPTRDRVVPPSYYVAGPFGPNLLKAYPPERDPAPEQVYRTGPGAEVRWKELAVTDGTLCLDFRRAFQKDYASGYALTYVHSPVEQGGELLVGSDDTIRVWVNGEPVHQWTRFRPARPDQDCVPVRWRAGWNTLLVKVVNVTGDHQFFLALTNASGLRPSVKKV